jgi:hypothetical protein
MVNTWQKYGGFIHLVLRLIALFLFWNAISNYTSIYWSFANLSRNILQMFVIIAVAVAFFSERKSFILIMLILSQLFALLQNIATLSQLFFLNEYIFWFHWAYTIIPIILILVGLVGFILISKRIGAMIVIITEIISVIYYLLAVALLIQDVGNGNYSFVLYNIFNAFIGFHFSLLLMVFIYRNYYKQNSYPKTIHHNDDITFQ